METRSLGSFSRSIPDIPTGRSLDSDTRNSGLIGRTPRPERIYSEHPPSRGFTDSAHLVAFIRLISAGSGLPVPIPCSGPDRRLRNLFTWADVPYELGYTNLPLLHRWFRSCHRFGTKQGIESRNHFVDSWRYPIFSEVIPRHFTVHWLGGRPTGRTPRAGI